LDDVQIAELNRQYLQRDYPTDVLAFPMAEGPTAIIQPQVMGDVVISVETAWRQSSSSKVSLDRELASLIVHGVLHLIGYDHELSHREKLRMRRMEKKLLQQCLSSSLGPSHLATST
jgi:probable rRNA maturation factor